MLIFSGIVVACFIPVAGLLKIFGLLFPRLRDSGNHDTFISLINIVFFVGLNLSAVVGSWFTLRVIDKRPYKLLGLDFDFRAATGFLKGFGLGFFNLIIIYIAMNIFGAAAAKVSALNSILLFDALKYFIAFAAAAFFEEIINRGYLFQALIEGTRAWIAAGIIALVFMAGHTRNKGSICGMM